MTDKRVTGIGGIFFKASDKATTAQWYREHLGIPVDESWGGAILRWRQDDAPERAGSTTWSPFSSDSDYFGKPEQQFMVNYRVADLDAVLAALRDEGVEVLEKIEESEYGRFGWIIDPDGRRVELWQPPEGM